MSDLRHELVLAAVVETCRAMAHTAAAGAEAAYRSWDEEVMKSLSPLERVARREADVPGQMARQVREQVLAKLLAPLLNRQP